MLWAIESGAPIYLQGLAPLSLLLTYSLEDGGAVVERNVPLVTVKLVSQQRRRPALDHLTSIERASVAR